CPRSLAPFCVIVIAVGAAPTQTAAALCPLVIAPTVGVVLASGTSMGAAGRHCPCDLVVGNGRCLCPQAAFLLALRSQSTAPVGATLQEAAPRRGPWLQSAATAGGLAVASHPCRWPGRGPLPLSSLPSLRKRSKNV
ncbi:hypothetical protein B296_00048497, partial [Ensete ventricosum]